jgi:hypothetical protein
LIDYGNTIVEAYKTKTSDGAVNYVTKNMFAKMDENRAAIKITKFIRSKIAKNSSKSTNSLAEETCCGYRNNSSCQAAGLPLSGNSAFFSNLIQIEKALELVPVNSSN